MEFLLPIVILAVVFVVFWLKKRTVKEKVEQAKIVAKAAEPHRTRGGDDDSLPTDYVVTFEVEGKRLQLIVNHSFYDSAVVGTAGKLTHIKDVFVEFESDNPRGYNLQ